MLKLFGTLSVSFNELQCDTFDVSFNLSQYWTVSNNALFARGNRPVSPLAVLFVSHDYISAKGVGSRISIIGPVDCQKKKKKKKKKNLNSYNSCSIDFFSMHNISFDGFELLFL